MKTPLIMLTALALAVPANAVAAERSATIEYRDLNLSSDEGLEELERRIDKAAKQVCNLDGVQTGSRMRSSSAKRCYKETKASLDQQFAGVVERHARGG